MTSFMAKRRAMFGNKPNEEKMGSQLIEDFLKNANEYKQSIANFCVRKYLEPYNEPMIMLMNPSLSSVIGKGYRDGLLVSTRENPHCLLTEALVLKEGKQDKEECCKNVTILHEVLFWKMHPNEMYLNREAKKALNDNYAKAEKKFKELLPIVNKIECEMLEKLEGSRNKICEKIGTGQIDWQSVLINVYCSAIHSLLALTEKMDFDQVYNCLKTLKFDAPALDDKKKTAANLAKAYAYVFDRLAKGERGITKKFVEILNRHIENKDKTEIQGIEKKLTAFLEWINATMDEGNIDIVTLAGLAHAGVIRLQHFKDENHRTGFLVENFILMSRGFPPNHIANIDEYMGLDTNFKSGNAYLRGLDVRPFLRLQFSNLQKTMDGIIETMEKGPSASAAVEQQPEMKEEAEGREMMRNWPIGTYSPMEIEPFGGVNLDSSEILVADESFAVDSGHHKKLKIDAAAMRHKETQPKCEENAPPIGWHSLFQFALEQFNPELLKFPEMDETEEEEEEFDYE